MLGVFLMRGIGRLQESGAMTVTDPVFRPC